MSKRLPTVEDLIKDAEGKHYYGYIVDFINNELAIAAEKWMKEASLSDCPGVSWKEENIENALAFNEGIEWFCKYFFNLEDEE